MGTNPYYVEIPVEPEKMDAFSSGRSLWKSRRETRQPVAALAMKRELLAALHRLIESELTPRQQECIRLYFLEGRTQQEVAEELGICRRVVSQHLFGICRNGRHVGGALKRIRKLCESHGLRV